MMFDLSPDEALKISSQNDRLTFGIDDDLGDDPRQSKGGCGCRGGGECDRSLPHR